MAHLTGSGNITNMDEGVVNYLIGRYNIKSFTDIGCGTGGMVEIAHNKGIKSSGYEGDIRPIKLSNVKDKIIQIDFTKTEPNIKNSIDLAYSTEFLEHVYEKFNPNYMKIFTNSKYILITAAPPNWPGKHHVNCQGHEYWIKIFNKYNIYHYPYETVQCRNNSTMNINRPKNKQFVKHRALFFINFNLVDKSNYIFTEDLPTTLEEIKENNIYLSDDYRCINVKDMNVSDVKGRDGILFESDVPIISKLKLN